MNLGVQSMQAFVRYRTFWLATVGAAFFASGACADIKITAPGKVGFANLKEKSGPITVHTDGWACGNQISDQSVFDLAGMTDLESKFRQYKLTLASVDGIRAKLAEDPSLADEILREAEDQVFSESFDNAAFDANRLANKYEGEGAIKQRDAAAHFDLTPSPVGGSGSVGENGRHPFMISVVNEAGDGVTEYELGFCYDMATLIERLAGLRVHATALREALDEAASVRRDVSANGAGS